MEYFSNMFGKMNEVVFPNTEEGFTATVKEYRDDIGKVVKVVIDVIPSVAEAAAGPAAGTAASAASYGAKAAKAFYDYLTTSVSKAKIQQLRRSPSSAAAAQAGAVVLKTALNLMGTAPANSLTETAQAASKKGVGTIAIEALKEGIQAASDSIPQVVVNLYHQGKPTVSNVLKLRSIAKSFLDLKTALGGLLNTRKLNQTAKAAIALIQEEEAKQAGTSRKKKGSKGTVSAKKAIATILHHKEEAKATYAKKSTSSRKKKR